MSRSKSIATTFVLAAWGVWALVSVTLLALARADALFVAVYACYLLSGGFLLVASRKNLLSPPGLFTLTGLFAFGFSIPVIFAGNRHIETSDVTSFEVTDGSLLKVLVIFLVAQTAFVAGYYLNPLRGLPFRRLLGTTPVTRRASLVTYLVMTAFVIVAGFIRQRLHLGEAGVQPTLPLAGYLQYTLFDGTLLFCAWFLAQGLRQSRVYVVLGLSLLMMMAVAQAMLGWRGGIAEVGWVMIGLFWFQEAKDRRKPYSLAWLVVLPLVAGSIVQFGNAVRSERLGGEKEFAASTGDLIQKIAYRSQGTTRLAVVAEHFGPLTLFNNFLIEDIYAEDLTTTTYIDRKLYAVARRQSHSVGTSGPGGPYVGMGLFGVMLAYAALGAFYRGIYSCVVNADKGTGSIIATVLYSYLIFMLSTLLSENFGIAFVKNMIAVFVVLFMLKLLINRREGQSAGIQYIESPAAPDPFAPRARIEP